jgi:hypothetical protein
MKIDGEICRKEGVFMKKIKNVITMILIFLLFITIFNSKTYAADLTTSNITISRGTSKSTINVDWPTNGVTITDADGKEHVVTTDEINTLKIDISSSKNNTISDTITRKKAARNTITKIHVDNDYLVEGAKVTMTYSYSVRMESYTTIYTGGSPQKVYDYAQGDIVINFEVDKVKDDEITIKNIGTQKKEANTASASKSDEIYASLPEKTSGGSSSEASLNDVMNDADNFISEADELTYDEEALQNFSKTFYNIMLTVGVVVAVLVGAFLGIKLMVSSVEEKADYKKLLVPYVVGCIVVFGGFTIWKLVVTILQSM